MSKINERTKRINLFIVSCFSNDFLIFMIVYVYNLPAKIKKNPETSKCSGIFVINTTRLSAGAPVKR